MIIYSLHGDLSILPKSLHRTVDGAKKAAQWHAATSTPIDWSYADDSGVWVGKDVDGDLWSIVPKDVLD